MNVNLDFCFKFYTLRPPTRENLDDQNDEPNQRKEKRDDDHRDGGDREYLDLQPVEEDESDQEYESAVEEPWPEDIWNEGAEKRIQAEAQAGLERQRRI